MMSRRRRRSDRVDVVAQSERRVEAGARAWTLRYLLCRITSGSAVAYAVRVHAREDGSEAEVCHVAGLSISEGLSADALFRRIADGCVFPSHLQDVVSDAAADPALRWALVAPPAN